MPHIAIVGVGAIGQRHVQSCATLPEAEYQMHLVEPDNHNRLNACTLLGGRKAVTWYESVFDLPKSVDIAVVATRADVRAQIVRILVDSKDVRFLFLEKVLFQAVADFAVIGRVLEQNAAKAWVNCARRMWPAYRQLRSRLEGQSITGIEVSGADWDIGCNAIHFLDLIGFLTGTRALAVDSVRLGEVRPAKRSGMLHIEGDVVGKFIRHAVPTPFSIVSAPNRANRQTIRIALTQGVIEIVENTIAMTVTWPGEKPSETVIPLQSQLTASAVLDVIAHGSCDLASYSESRGLHETFIVALLGALNRAGKIADRKTCPIT